MRVPADIVETTTDQKGKDVEFTVTATDDVDPSDRIKIRCEPKSGDRFPIGTTKVTCTATDAADNESSGAFNVTVRLVDGNDPEPKVPADIVVETTDREGTGGHVPSLGHRRLRPARRSRFSATRRRAASSPSGRPK